MIFMLRIKTIEIVMGQEKYILKGCTALQSKTVTNSITQLFSIA